MAASLSHDGKIWAFCQYCRTAIWKYPNGKLWRDSYENSTCQDSPTASHNAER